MDGVVELEDILDEAGAAACDYEAEFAQLCEERFCGGGDQSWVRVFTGALGWGFL